MEKIYITQSRIESVVESITSTGIGFMVSWGAWIWIIGPFFDVDLTVSDNFWITVFFTFLSFGRQYVVRRWFNTGLHRRIHGLVQIPWFAAMMRGVIGGWRLIFGGK